MAFYMDFSRILWILSKLCSSPPPPEDPHPERFSLKTSFLAVVIAPVPFLFHVTYFITREKLKTGAKGGETKKKWR